MSLEKNKKQNYSSCTSFGQQKNCSLQGSRCNCVLLAIEGATPSLAWLSRSLHAAGWAAGGSHWLHWQQKRRERKRNTGWKRTVFWLHVLSSPFRSHMGGGPSKTEYHSFETGVKTNRQFASAHPSCSCFRTHSSCAAVGFFSTHLLMFFGSHSKWPAFGFSEFFGVIEPLSWNFNFERNFNFEKKNV